MSHIHSDTHILTPQLYPDGIFATVLPMTTVTLEPLEWRGPSLLIL